VAICARPRGPDFDNIFSDIYLRSLSNNTDSFCCGLRVEAKQTDETGHASQMSFSVSVQDLQRSRDASDYKSEQEDVWRTDACDYEQRFCGHCNTTTDIKEANFFGRY